MISHNLQQTRHEKGRYPSPVGRRETQWLSPQGRVEPRPPRKERYHAEGQGVHQGGFAAEGCLETLNLQCLDGLDVSKFLAWPASLKDVFCNEIDQVKNLARCLPPHVRIHTELELTDWEFKLARVPQRVHKLTCCDPEHYYEDGDTSDFTGPFPAELQHLEMMDVAFSAASLILPGKLKVLEMSGTCIDDTDASFLAAPVPETLEKYPPFVNHVRITLRCQSDHITDYVEV